METADAPGETARRSCVLGVVGLRSLVVGFLRITLLAPPMPAKPKYRASLKTEDQKPKASGMFTAFRKMILKIPKGKVSTYGAIACVSGYPGAARQVVWALRANRGLPWHRVIGAGGVIKLPGEQGFEQRMMLRQEGIELTGLRVDLKKYEHNFFARKKPVAKKPTSKKRKSRVSR
jgi:methylated-DNA-protein-cysteine methyltransferase-like protein